MSVRALTTFFLCMHLLAGSCFAAVTPPSVGRIMDGEGYLVSDEAYYDKHTTERGHSIQVTPGVVHLASARPLELSETSASGERQPDSDLFSEGLGDQDMIPDPIESLNRFFFDFNDKLYFWILKPVATGYKALLPEVARVGVRNFFFNLRMPIHAINCLLQGKLEGFGIEVSRFVLNTTVGVCGFWDPAKKFFNYQRQDEDFGQTLGFYGFGPGFYIDWPFLGPKSFRDTVGFVAGLFLDPLDYIVSGIDNAVLVNMGIRAYDIVNKTSLELGEYESFKKAAIDPYVSLRDAYYQYRKSKIKE